ncbi:pentatricopeptide repeat-containing protein [Canna indica]|uniref:Pentatricopeptide repeat-containing protein n=1 Tax=Canna indica TaxID=4628 RepID=A0AAQ3KLH7_9LILI|nr:pentatricopeptide repeat-containing protein [Canna indica]
MLSCSCALSSSPSISKFISDHSLLSLLETQCANMRDLRQLHSQLIKTGLARDHVAVSRVLAFCATSPHGDLNYAARLFSHHQNSNAFMYDTLIRGFSKSSTPHLALSLFLDMLRSPTQPVSLTFPSLFVACSHLGHAHAGAQLHTMVLKLGLTSDPYICNSMLSMYANCGHISESLQLFDECASLDVVSWNSMITGLAKNGQVDKARCLFDNMPVRNLVSWGAMIGGYARAGRNKDALHLFYQMQEARINPNANILVSLLGACASLAALEQGEWIHHYIERNKFELNPIVLTAIIDMYCKSGSIKKALEVFDKSPTKGLPSWNSLILGLAMHGHFEEATQLFSRLQSSSLKPDNVTFLNILTACNHSGMVDEAMHYFSLMINDYSIEPGIEHYGCMVDLLGRAGLLEEAEKLIQMMPVEPDPAIWGSLLSAGRFHRNVDIARRAGREVLQLDDLDTGGYVLLSNTYAEAGETSNAIKTRVKMKEQKVRKEPGCSMIEIDGLTYEFVAGGMMHPQAKEVYEILEGLASQLRREYHEDISSINMQE